MASPIRIIGPISVAGSDAGPYKNGSTVWVKSKAFFNMQVDRNDIVIFQRPQYESGEYINDIESIGEIVGLPGDEVTDKTYYFSQKKAEGKTPVGFFIIRLDNGDILRLIPASKVTHIVFYP